MRECPTCGNVYPDQFQSCPVEGAALRDRTESAEAAKQAPRQPPVARMVRIHVRTLILAILLLMAVVSSASILLYRVWKSKYGSLVVNSTPTGATVFVDGRLRGVTPLTLRELRSGRRQIKAVKEGYKELIKQVEVVPSDTQIVHWILDPLIPRLSNEQLAEIESWRIKLDEAQKENILLPPPDDYNVLLFANKILAIDPANSFALDAKSNLAEEVRRGADQAYARTDWLKAEKQYKDLALLFPNDISISERLTDIAGKIDARAKDREQQIAQWKAKAETGFRTGNLLPPARDNAFDAVQIIQRLDRKSEYARKALAQLKAALQKRGDTKVAGGDWQGARNDFRLGLQYFPDDAYCKSRLTMVEAKIGEQSQAERQRLQRMQEEEQFHRKVAALRLSALGAYRAGAYAKSISEWQEYLKFEPNSDEAYFCIGAASLELKQSDAAILNFEKCLSINPNNALAHVNLGVLYDRHRGDIAKAVEHFKKAKDLGGTENYSTEKLQGIVQDLQDRQQMEALRKVSFAVEHKHAFSSCRGTIRISDEGIDFKTTETNHSFYEQFKGLIDISINGEEMSIRTQSNKKYNFRFQNAGDAEKVRFLAARHIRIAG